MRHTVKVRRGVEYQQTRVNGPMWERDLPHSAGAHIALGALEAYVGSKPKPSLPPASVCSEPKRQRSSNSRGPTVESRLKPLVEKLRELEKRERHPSSALDNSTKSWQSSHDNEPPVTSMVADVEAAIVQDLTPLEVLIQHVLQQNDAIGENGSCGSGSSVGCSSCGSTSVRVGSGTTGYYADGQRQTRPHPQLLRILGLEPGASRLVVRKRFLALALRLHPDKTSHPRAREAFGVMEQAFRKVFG